MARKEYTTDSMRILSLKRRMTVLRRREKELSNSLSLTRHAMRITEHNIQEQLAQERDERDDV